MVAVATLITEKFFEQINEVNYQYCLNAWLCFSCAKLFFLFVAGIVGMTLPESHTVKAACCFLVGNFCLVYLFNCEPPILSVDAVQSISSLMVTWN